MRDATICFLLNEEENKKQILLGMKKRGFGANKWTGFGGKVNDGEEIEDATCREVFEEIGVIISKNELIKMGEIYFYVQNESKWDQLIHVFLVRKWDGEPRESEEMKPEWFNVKSIPYKNMWADDEYWLPLILKNKRIKAKFVFKPDNETILEHEINEIEQ